jgi:DDE family transposase
MPVSHAPVSSRALNAAPGHERGPGLLEVLAQVADPRKRRGRRFTLAFTLAVAVACVLAGARSFREIGDQAADLPQDMLAELGGVPCPLRRRIPVPSEKRIRTLLQDLDGDALDVTIGGWLRSLAAAGKPAGRRTARRGTSRSTASGCAASATGRSSCSPRSSTAKG